MVAVAKAAEEGSKAVICASTGNTSASAAAYAAAAGLRCVVVVPDGKIALGKLAQAMIHGARVMAIDGNFDDALELVRELAERRPIALVNSVNPYRIEGQKTAAFEVCRRPGRARPTCTACRWATPATSRPTGRASASTRRPGWRRACRGCWASRPPAPRPSSCGAPVDKPADHRHGHPHRQPGQLAGRRGRPRRIGRPHRRGHRRRDPGGLPLPGVRRGHLLRAGQRGGRGGAPEAGGRRGGCRRESRGAASSPATASRTRTRRCWGWRSRCRWRRSWGRSSGPSGSRLRGRAQASMLQGRV